MVMTRKISRHWTTRENCGLLFCGETARWNGKKHLDLWSVFMEIGAFIENAISKTHRWLQHCSWELCWSIHRELSVRSVRSVMTGYHGHLVSKRVSLIVWVRLNCSSGQRSIKRSKGQKHLLSLTYGPTVSVVYWYGNSKWNKGSEEISGIWQRWVRVILKLCGDDWNIGCNLLFLFSVTR